MTPGRMTRTINAGVYVWATVALGVAVGVTVANLLVLLGVTL